MSFTNVIYFGVPLIYFGEETVTIAKNGSAIIMMSVSVVYVIWALYGIMERYIIPLKRHTFSFNCW